jgi:hypothetical protein
MNEFTVIQRLVWLASFLAGLSSYVHMAWATRRLIPVMLGQRFLPARPEVLPKTSFFLSALHSGKQNDMLGGGGLQRPDGQGRASTKDRLSILGDWLAPIIVCFLVITMSLAIVGFLLGER